MADSFIQLPPDSTGKLIDTSSVVVGANTVQRERDNIADPTDPLGLAKVENTDPASSDYGLVVRAIPSATTPTMVEGVDADNTPVTVPSVLVGGTDGIDAHTFLTNEEGQLSLATDQIPGEPIPDVITPVGGEDPNGNAQVLQVDSSGNLKVALQSSGAPAQVVLVPQVPGTNGVVNPQLVKTDPTTNDLLIQLIMEMRAVRVILSHLASETGDAQFNDFDPNKWVESDTIQV